MIVVLIYLALLFLNYFLVKRNFSLAVVFACDFFFRFVIWFELVTAAFGLGVFNWIVFSIQSSTKLVLDHYDNPPESVQKVFTRYNNSFKDNPNQKS